MSKLKQLLFSLNEADRRVIEEKLKEKDKEISKLQSSCQQVKTQLAIQELEKVKVNLKDRITMMSNEEHSYLQKVVIWYDICNQVNKQIKELKGEKDVKD